VRKTTRNNNGVLVLLFEHALLCVQAIFCKTDASVIIFVYFLGSSKQFSVPENSARNRSDSLAASFYVSSTMTRQNAQPQCAQ
jgi:hypothetical protein